MAPTTTFQAQRAATTSGVGWMLAVAGFGLSAATDALWGWEGPAMATYSLGSIVLVAAGAMLVVTQVGLGRLHGGLGVLAGIGIAFTAVGALLSFVSWAVPVWASVLGIGTLLFGVPLLRRGLVPRRLGLVLTFALPAAAAVSLVGAIFNSGDDGSTVAIVLTGGLVAAAVVALAMGLLSLGRWVQAAPAGS